MDKQISLASNMSVIQTTGGTMINPLTGRKIMIGNTVYKKLLKDKVIIETNVSKTNAEKLSLPKYGPASGEKQRKERRKIRKKKYQGSSADDKSFFSHSYSDTDPMVSNLSKKYGSDDKLFINKNTPEESKLTAVELKKIKENQYKKIEGFERVRRTYKSEMVSHSKQDIQALLRNAMYVKKVWDKQEARGISPNIFNKFSQYHKKLTGSDSVSSVKSDDYSAELQYMTGSSLNKTLSGYESSNKSMLPSSSSSAKSSSKSSSAKSSKRSDTRSNANLSSYPEKSVPMATTFYRNSEDILEKKIQKQGLKAAFSTGYAYLKKYPELEDSHVWIKLEKALQKVLDDNNYRKEYLKAPAILEMENLIKEAYQKAGFKREKKLLKDFNEDIYTLWTLITHQVGRKRYLAKKIPFNSEFSVPEASSYNSEDEFVLENKIMKGGLEAIFKSAYSYIKDTPVLRNYSPLWQKLEKDLQKVLNDNNYKKEYLKAPAILEMQILIRDAEQKASTTRERNLLKYLNEPIYTLWDLHFTHLKQQRYIAKKFKLSDQSDQSDQSETGNLEMESYYRYSVPDASESRSVNEYENEVKANGLKAMFKFGYDYVERHPELKKLPLWINLEKDMQKVLDDNNYKKHYLQAPAILAIQNLILDAYKKVKGREDKNLIIYLYDAIIEEWDVHYGHLKHARHYQNMANFSKYGVTKMHKMST